MKILIILVSLLLSFNSNAMPFSTAQTIYNKIVKANGIKNPPKLIFDDSEEINAYYDGRVIGLDKGMLLEVRNQSEIAWVLGHELGHYLRKDKGSRPDREYAADKWGVKLGGKAGYNMCVGTKLLIRFNSDGGTTHPSSKNRYRRVRC